MTKEKDNKKGFKKTKKPTKAQMENQVQQQAQQAQAMVQSLMQTMQKVRQLEMEVVAMANLLRTNESNNTAEEGDLVMIDYYGKTISEDGSVGEAFDGGFGVGYILQGLGSGKLIKDMEDSLYGKKAGDAFAVNIKFPTDYPAKNLADKEAKFDVAVIKVWKKPEYDKSIENLKIQDDELKRKEAANESETK